MQSEFLPGQGQRGRNLQQRKRHHRSSRQASSAEGIPPSEDPLGNPDRRLQVCAGADRITFTTPPLPPPNEFNSPNATAGGKKYNLTDENTPGPATGTDYKYEHPAAARRWKQLRPQGSDHPQRGIAEGSEGRRSGPIGEPLPHLALRDGMRDRASRGLGGVIGRAAERLAGLRDRGARKPRPPGSRRSPVSPACASAAP